MSDLFYFPLKKKQKIKTKISFAYKGFGLVFRCVAVALKDCQVDIWHLLGLYTNQAFLV